MKRKPSENSRGSKGVRESKESIEGFGGEYYEECKKYAFKGEMKTKGKRKLDRSEDSV